MAHVQRTGHGGRRGVDRVDGAALARIVECIGAVGVPDVAPLGFKPVHAHTVGQGGEIGADGDVFAISHTRQSKKRL